MSGKPLPFNAYTSMPSTLFASSILIIIAAISTIATSSNLDLINSTIPPSALTLSISSTTPILKSISTIFAFTSNFSPLFLLL